MPSPTQKHCKLYIKDASGEIIQMLPRTTIPEYQGATSSSNGTAGLVPAATSAQKDNFLKGDGTWAQVAWSDVTSKPSSFTPTAHASSATTYGVSSASNYGHAKASSTTPKAPASTASVGSETSSFARGDHVHPMQKAVTGVSGSCSPNVARHIVDENVSFELPMLEGNMYVSSVSSNMEGQYFELNIQGSGAPITNLREDFLTSGVIYWSDSFNIFEESSVPQYLNDPSDYSDVTIDSFENIYLGTRSWFSITFNTSTVTGNDLRPYPVSPEINETLDNLYMTEDLYISVPPQVGETITFKNVPVTLGTTYDSYSNDSEAPAEDLEFFEKYVGSFDFFLERQSTTNFRTGFRWNAPGGATVELTAANSDSTTDTSSFIIPEYHGASTNVDGGSGLVPAAKSSERNYYLKGDGTWGQVEIPQISNYTGATSSANGVAGLVPPATSAQQENFLKGDGTWATVSTEKDVAVRTSEPTVANTTTLANESIIFYNTGSAQNAPQPVFTSGNQTIGGVKTFSAGIFSGKQAMSGTAMDCAAASCFTKTVTGTTTFSFTNVPSDAVCCVTLVLINGGNYTVNWPSSVKWTGNLPPELTSNGTDVLTFLTCTGGNVWYGTTTCIGVTA